jgi:hypothetical protein
MYNKTRRLLYSRRQKRETKRERKRKDYLFSDELHTLCPKRECTRKRERKEEFHSMRDIRSLCLILFVFSRIIITTCVEKGTTQNDQICAKIVEVTCLVYSLREKSYVKLTICLSENSLPKVNIKSRLCGKVFFDNYI